MTRAGDPDRTARLEALRRQRATDMLGLIGKRAPIDLARFGDTKVSMSGAPEPLRAALHGRGGPELRACSARELEWLQPELDLRSGIVVRTDLAPNSKYGVVSPFTRSVLIVTYTARYFLSDAAPPSTAQRAIHVVYGALQATELPVGRDLPPI